MATTGKVVGPGGSSKSAKSTGCTSQGPGGISGGKSTTTGRGYDNSRTQGMRSAYQSTGKAGNGSR